ncbi:NAD(P)-binding protein [Thelephora terrestris]|uniref:NAD(P)-binding protein n=1 Tax=Thelephora terrestris TaxID=56493 RepID=A0A9P6LAR7_9AGAM|nr:NAD(P)-binding protein [Thelephora terrestris]
MVAHIMLPGPTLSVGPFLRRSGLSNVDVMQDLLSVIGFLFCLYHFRSLLDVIWFYYLRPTDTYRKYLTGPRPYALITGATDGIGKALAKELYDKGFNLIVHGRNEEKILSVIDELKSCSSSGGEVRYFVADAGRDDVDFEEIARKFEGLNVTLMVNNVGGIKIRLERFDEWTEEEHLIQVRTNAIFPTLLTRAFLSSLRATARERPVLVAFMGSTSDETAMPRIPLYTASKAYVRQLAPSLHADERFEIDPNGGHDRNIDGAIEFTLVHLGSVRSGLIVAPVNFWRPSSEEFAKKLVGTFGCGRRYVVPYFGHAVALKMRRSWPEWYVEREVLKSTRAHLDREGRGRLAGLGE